MIVIMIISTIGFILALLYVLVDWGKILRERFANNPARGRVYIKVGEDLIRRDAKLTGETDKGQVYKYNWQGKAKIVIVPADYPVEYCDSRRVLAVKGGRLVASRLAGTPAGKDFDTQTISALVTSHIVTDLVLSLTGKGMPKWVWIIAGIGAVAIIAYLMKGCGGGGAVAPPGAVPINPATGEPFSMLLLMLGV